MGAAESSQMGEGIITVQGRTETDGVDPIMMHLRDLQQLVPILGQTGVSDPVWRDLLALPRSEMDLTLDAASVLSLVESYKSWCQSQAASVVERQELVNHRILYVESLASEVIAETTKAAKESRQASEQYDAVAQMQLQIQDMRRRAEACLQNLQSLEKEIDAHRGTES